MSVLNSFIGTVGSLRAGGTISGDVTIEGDLTIDGGGSYAFSEVVTGDMRVQKAALSSAPYDANAIIIAENDTYAFFQTASATKGGIYFGDASSIYVGGVTYTHGTDTLDLRAGGGDRMTLDTNSRISLSNNDSSGAVGTTLFGYLAGQNVISGVIRNTFIGHGVGDATLTTAADNNTGVGFNALTDLTSGAKNLSLIHI